MRFLSKATRHGCGSLSVCNAPAERHDGHSTLIRPVRLLTARSVRANSPSASEPRRGYRDVLSPSENRSTGLYEAFSRSHKAHNSLFDTQKPQNRPNALKTAQRASVRLAAQKKTGHESQALAKIAILSRRSWLCVQHEHITTL
jgi:hypothetical protein